MDISTLYIAIALFAAGAGFGFILLHKILHEAPTPKKVVLAHGIFGGIALILVAWYALRNTENAPVWSLILLVAAAAGGFTLLAYDLGNKKIPKALAIGHPIIAACGLITLIYFVVTQ